jgi:hypothetical protein
MAQHRSLRCITVLTCAFLLFNSACGHKNPVVGKWVETNDPAHQLIITQQGETFIVEEINTKISGLNSKSPATYRDGVLRLESGFGRPTFFYDSKTDRLSGQSMIGKIEFKRQ